MSLQNLLKIGQLAEHVADKKQIGKMLVAAERYLDDARQGTISYETRLDTFRVKRNAIAYTGDDVDEGSVLACITAAEQLRVHVTDWVSSNAPELIA